MVKQKLDTAEAHMPNIADTDLVHVCDEMLRGVSRRVSHTV